MQGKRILTATCTNKKAMFFILVNKFDSRKKKKIVVANKFNSVQVKQSFTSKSRKKEARLCYSKYKGAKAEFLMLIYGMLVFRIYWLRYFQE